MTGPQVEADERASVLDQPLNRARQNVEFDPANMGMAPVSLEVLVLGEPVPADFFLPLYDRAQGQVIMKPACCRGDEFKSVWRDRLLEANQRTVYVSLEQLPLLSDYFQKHAGGMLQDGNLPIRKRRLLIQELSALNLREVFASDLSPQNLKKAVDHSEKMLKRVTDDPGLLNNLSQLLRNDYNIYTHSVNVSLVAMAFGAFLKFPQARVESLGMAGMLHDLGQAKLPAGLKNKPGPLSDEEWVVMRGHPSRAHQLLSAISTVSIDVLKMVLHHHENADGSGYPQGLNAERTPMGARILRVVDAYDAMTSERPWRPVIPAMEAAGVILKESPQKYGMDLGPRFVRFLASPFMAD